jgi:hypothetical protein
LGDVRGAPGTADRPLFVIERRGAKIELMEEIRAALTAENIGFD